jgi:hypothetical protein
MAKAAEKAEHNYKVMVACGTPEAQADAKAARDAANRDLKSAIDAEAAQSPEAAQASSDFMAAGKRFQAARQAGDSDGMSAAKADGTAAQDRKRDGEKQAKKGIRKRLQKFVLDESLLCEKPAPVQNGGPTPKPTPEKKPGLLDSILGHVTIGIGGGDKRHGGDHSGGDRTRTPETKPATTMPPSPQD